MLGGSTLGIGLTMYLKDQFSGPAGKIRGSATQLQAQIMLMQQEQLRYQRNLYAGLAIGGAMALRGMGRMVKRASEFSYEMQFVKAVTQATIQEQLRLTNISKRLGRETMFYPQDIAEGMRFMAMAGMSAKEVEKNIQGAVTLAGSTKSQLGGKGGAADIMTNVMKQFKVGFEYTNDVANILSYAVTKANTNLFDLGEALKYAGSTSMDLNISLPETTAMVMALGNAGMQGSMAGVAMENSMRYLSRAFSSFGSGPSKDALAELGLTIKDVTDQSGNLLSMTQVMKAVGKSVDKTFGSGMNIEKQAILQSVFGVRGKRAASLFLRNLKEFETFTSDISNVSVNYAGNVMNSMMSTIRGSFFKLGSAWESMWISFTTKNGPLIISISKVLTKVLGGLERLFDTPVIGGFVSTAIAGFVTLKTVSFAYRSVVAGLKLLHLQSGNSAISMANATTGAYNRMTAASMKYAAASRMTSSYSAAGSGGMFGYNKRLFRGTGGYFVRTPMGGYQTFKSTSAAAKAARATGAARMATKGAASRFGFGMAKMAAGTGARAVAGGILGRLVGFLGGPVGMALSFVLPGLIGGVIDVIGRNKRSTEENTKRLEENNRMKVRQESSYGRMGHMIDFLDIKRPELSIIGSTATDMVKSDINRSLLDDLSRKLAQTLKSDERKQEINIYLDGEPVVQRVLEKSISDSLNIFQ